MIKLSLMYLHLPKTKQCLTDIALMTSRKKIAAKPGCLKTKQGGVVTTKRSEFTAEQAIPELFHHLGSRM